MKKYITIATLLAAGTAFANAETPTLANSSGFVWRDGELLKAEDGLTLTELSGGYTLSGTTFFSETGDTNRKQGTIALVFDSEKLSATDHTNLITLGSGWGLGYKDSVFTGTWGSGQYNTYQTADITGKIDDVPYIDNDGTVTLTIALDNEGTQISIGSNPVALWTNKSLKGNVSSNGITISALAASALEKMVIWNFSVYGDTVATTAAKSVVQNVPEPSAFGLLAGIGALALVASRRRRK